MATARKSRKPIAKANSPVTNTGLRSPIKKRLLQGKPEKISRGREEILQAARACFAKQGFSGTSIKDIQNASGFSRGNLYHHFKTKEEIVQIIITQNLGRFCDRIDSILFDANEHKPTLQEIIKHLASFAEEITKGPGRGMAFHVWSLAMVDAEVRQIMQTYFERIRAALEKQIVLLQTQGKLPKHKNTKALSVALFGIVIPGFTLQSVFMDEMSINANQYANCLSVLFKSA